MTTQLTDSDKDKCVACGKVIMENDRVILAGESITTIFKNDGNLYGHVTGYKIFHYDCLPDFDRDTRA